MPAKKRKTEQHAQGSQEALSSTETQNTALSIQSNSNHNTAQTHHEDNISYINNIVGSIAENIKSQFEEDFGQFVLVIINAHSHNEHLQKLIQVSKEQGELLSNKEIKDIVSTSIKAVVNGLMLTNSLDIANVASKYLGENALSRLDKIFDMVRNEANRLLCTDKYTNTVIVALSINQDSDYNILNMVNRMLGNTTFGNGDIDDDTDDGDIDDITGFNSDFDLPF